MKRTLLIVMLALVAWPGDSADIRRSGLTTPQEHQAKFNYTRPAAARCAAARCGDRGRPGRRQAGNDP